MYYYNVNALFFNCKRKNVITTNTTLGAKYARIRI